MPPPHWDPHISFLTGKKFNKESFVCLLSPRMRKSTTFFDSKYWITDSLCQWHLDSGFHSLVGFRIPFVGGIPDSLSHSPDSKAQYSGLIPQSKIFRIVESLHGATIKNTVFLSVCFLTATWTNFLSLTNSERMISGASLRKDLMK